MRFALFLVLQVVLFLRPTELVPGLEEVPLYEAVIIACLVASAGRIVELLSGRSLVASPTTACVFGLLGAVVLSHVAQSNLYDARESGLLVAKLVAYYLVVVANVDTPVRLDRTLRCIGLLTLCVAALSVLEYHEVIELTAVEPYMERQDPDADGNSVVLARLRGSGIFSDPNDICVVLTIGAAACVFAFEDRRAGWVRFAWLVPVGLFAYTIALTHSRGGLLAALGGGFAYLVARVGVRRAALVAAALLPVAAVAYGGRQTNLDTSSGTAQDRIQLWSEAFECLKESPLTGIGFGEFVQRAHLVAHNSFLHAFAELGLVGGSIFLGAFGYLLLTVARIGGRNPRVAPELRRAHPAVLMMVVALSIGMMSLSRGYAQPTYLVAGLAASYLSLTAQNRPDLAPGLSSRMVARMAGGSLGFLVVMYFFVLASVHWGA
jgi:O-antigen ligase